MMTDQQKKVLCKLGIQFAYFPFIEGIYQKGQVLDAMNTNTKEKIKQQLEQWLG